MQHYNPLLPLPRHGKINGKIWKKRVSREKHQLRRPPAWAVDAIDLDRAEALGAEWLELHIVGEGYAHVALKWFRKYGMPLDRKHGKQIALFLGHFTEGRVGDSTATKSHTERQMELSI